MSIGGLRIFPRLRAAVRNGKKIEIQSKAFDVLLALIAASGEVLTKDELLSLVWPDQLVEENNLQAQISSIRRALGPDRGLLTTVFGRGYRLDIPDASRAALKKESAGAGSPHGLPVPLSPLLGRQAEIAVLAGMVVGGSLVTLIGSGGIGKTRLSIEIGYRLTSSFRDGVRFAGLASLTNPDLVFPTIAAHLNIDAGFGHDTMENRSKLRALKLLLVLDNCEHLIEAVAQTVHYLLGLAPGVAILATSQEPLAIEGEQIYWLQPLGLPPEDAETLSGALRHAAADLLIQRVMAADRTYQVSDAQTTDICRVCRQLDGIPLALELAAARIPLIGLQAVVSGLSDRFRLLTAGRRTGLPRHQTLRATLEWSFGLLKSDEQLLLSRLCIFAGSFTLHAVCAVCAVTMPQSEDRWDITDLLTGLVMKSLVVKEPDGAANRFRLFESTRAFALDNLASSGVLPVLSACHATHFRSRLTEAARDWRTMPSGRWMTEYRDDLSDVRIALDWTFSNEAGTHDAAQALCASLPFWTQLSLLDECRSRVEAALEKFSSRSAESVEIEMKLQGALGASIAWVKGPTPGARVAWTRALALAQQLDNVEHRIQAHYGLWLYNLRSGRYRLSLDHASALRELGAGHHDVRARQAGERASGVSLHFMGNHTEAVELIEMMLTRHAAKQNHSFPFQFGIDQNVAGLAFLSRVLWIRGDGVRAVATASMGVRDAETLGHASSLCCALLEGACTVSALADDMDALAAQSATAIKVSEGHGLGFWWLYANAFACLAQARRHGTMDAIERLRGAMESLRQINLAPGYSVFQTGLAQSLIAMGHPMEAFTVIEGLIRSIDMDAHWGAPEILRIRAEIDSKRIDNKPGNSRWYMDQTLGIAQRQGEPHCETCLSEQRHDRGP